MKTTLLLLLSGVVIPCLFSQPVIHQWSYAWGNQESDPAPTMTIDTNGQVYVAGTFTGNMDFDPGSGETFYQATPFTRESYISKFDAAGQFLWVIIFKTTAIINIKEIIHDQKGHLLATGDFSGTVDFDPGAGNYSLTSTGSASETFIVKLNEDGAFVWANATQGTGQKYGSEIDVDREGNVFCAGIFTGTGDFNPGPGSEVFTAEGFVDGFVSKFDASGQFIWSLHHAGNFQVGINALEVDDDGNVWIGGAFDDIRDFDPGPDSLILTATGAWDGFIQKFSSDGQFVWVETLANGADNWVYDLKSDEEGQLFATGYYSGTLDFDNGPGEATHTAILNDIYIAKYDAAGALQWVSVFEGTSFDRGNSLVLDRNGNVYTTGFFGEEIDFDPGQGLYLLTSTGDNDTDDGFLSVLNPEGQFLFAAQVGGIANDMCGALAIDPEDDILMSGFFTGKAAFYPDQNAPDSLTSKGLNDAFLVKWQQCLPTQGTLDAIACGDSYISPSGQFEWTEEGTYLDTLMNTSGCDSLLTIHLSFVEIDLNIDVVPGSALIAEETDAAYQWVDCANGFTPIDGATEQTFSPEVSGQYAVILTKAECIDTSACVDLLTSNRDLIPSARVTVYPNPFHQSFTISCSAMSGINSVSILTMEGTRLYAESRQDRIDEEIYIDLLPGWYLLEIVDKGFRSYIPIVKY